MLPFLIRTDTDDGGEGEQRIYSEVLDCRVGPNEKSLSVACQSVTVLTHSRKFILYTLIIVLCDLWETRETMLQWTRPTQGVPGGVDVGPGVLVNAKHAEFLGAYMRRFSYKYLALHFAVRYFDIVRSVFVMAFARFNESYCSGENREVVYCYKYNSENKDK